MFSICPSIMVPLLVIYPFQNHYITITVLVGHVFFNWPMGINGNGWEYILFGPIGLTHQIQMCQTQTHLHRLIQCMPILQCIYIYVNIHTYVHIDVDIGIDFDTYTIIHIYIFIYLQTCVGFLPGKACMCIFACCAAAQIADSSRYCGILWI